MFGVEQLGLHVQELLDLAVQVGRVEGLRARRLAQVCRLAGEGGARRVARLDALRTGRGAGGLAVDDDVLREEAAHVGAGARDRCARIRIHVAAHAASPCMYLAQAWNWLRITTSEVPWFEYETPFSTRSSP